MKIVQGDHQSGLLGVIMLTLVRSHNHENGTSADGHDAHIEIKSKARIKKRVTTMTTKSMGWWEFPQPLLPWRQHCGRSKHLLGRASKGAVPNEHDTDVLAESRRSREKLRLVVDKHHFGVDDGGGNNRQEQVGCKLKPANVIIGKRNNQDILGVSGHGQSRSDVGSGGQRKKVRKRVGNLVADTQVNNNTGEDKHDGIVHHGG
jgi:hypothetical protein